MHTQGKFLSTSGLLMPKRKKKMHPGHPLVWSPSQCPRWELGVLVSTCILGSVSGQKGPDPNSGDLAHHSSVIVVGGCPLLGILSNPPWLYVCIICASVAPLGLGMGFSWHPRRLEWRQSWGRHCPPGRYLRAWRGAGETPKLRAKGGRAGTGCF